MYGAKKHRRGRSGRVGNANADAVSAFAPIIPFAVGRSAFQTTYSTLAVRTFTERSTTNLGSASKDCITNSKEATCDRCFKVLQEAEGTTRVDLKRDDDRKRLSKLSKEIESLTQHKLKVTDSLRRIRSNAKLSSNDMRAAIGKVLDMASVLPYENKEPSDDTRASTDREECAISSAARSTELDFFDSSFDTTTAIQMLRDTGQIHGYYEDPCQHLVTTVAPQVPFSFPIDGRELVHESMHLSGGRMNALTTVVVAVHDALTFAESSMIHDSSDISSTRPFTNARVSFLRHKSLRNCPPSGVDLL
ncbi:hypothetical protein WAI453_013194 [Rhynchosporium graminicola]